MGFSDLLKKLSKLGQDTKNGVQKVSDSVTISNRISQEKKSLGRLFATIGETVYKESPDVPKPGMEDEWAAVKVAYANIETYTEQLNNVKGIIYCPNCGRPAANGDKFCAKCGFRIDIYPETTGQKMANDIKEAGQEVGRIAGQAADRTGEMVGGAAAETKNALSWIKEKLKWPKKNEDSESGQEENAEQSVLPGADTAADQRDAAGLDVSETPDLYQRRSGKDQAGLDVSETPADQSGAAGLDVSEISSDMADYADLTAQDGASSLTDDLALSSEKAGKDSLGFGIAAADTGDIEETPGKAAAEENKKTEEI